MYPFTFSLHLLWCTDSQIAHSIKYHSYICEYKTRAVYSVKEKATYERLHELNTAGSYVIETYYSVPKVGRLCFDATERFHHPGRYINHVARGGNVRLSCPFFIRGKWRIGFLALRNISAGEELAYDYLDRDREQQWLQEGRLVDGRVVASGEAEEREGDNEKEEGGEADMESLVAHTDEEALSNFLCAH